MSDQGGAEAHTQNSGEVGLTASQVVARLGSYRLDYVGFPKNLHAEMIVDVIYMAPDSKEFKVVSETGSGWMIKHIFKRLLESEHEALEGGNRERTTLNSENYDFTMLMDKSTEVGCRIAVAGTTGDVRTAIFRRLALSQFANNEIARNCVQCS